MSKEEVVDTVRGKYHKYEVVKKPGGVFSSTKFYVHKDGKPFKGPYDSLADAYEAAKNAG